MPQSQTEIEEIDSAESATTEAELVVRSLFERPFGERQGAQLR
jgi:hypothetical protein